MQGLDRRIDIERFTASQDDSGQEVESWTKVASRRAAWMRPLTGSERYVAAQYAAFQQVEFRVRYSDDLANLNPLDRVIYPAASGDSPGESPAREPDIYDIIEVSELGRREALRIIAARRAENAE